METITISTSAIAIVAGAVFWLFFSWAVFSFLRTHCMSSDTNCNTNLDLFFQNGKGADTPAWKKHLVAWPLVILGPVTVFGGIGLGCLIVAGEKIANLWS